MKRLSQCASLLIEKNVSKRERKDPINFGSPP